MNQKKKECPSCAMEINAKSKVCPICAYEFTSAEGGRKWIAIFLLVLILIAILYRLI